MKITLIRPDSRDLQYGPLVDIAAIEPPLWLLMRAGFLKEQGHQVEVIDLEIEGTSSALSSVISDVFELVSWGQNPTSFNWQQVDGLVQRCPGHVASWKSLPPFNIAAVPLWSAIDVSDYRAHSWHCLDGSPRSPYGVTFTSYGCPYRCSFCVTRGYYNNRYRERDLRDTMKDLKYFAENKVKKIKFIDEMFFLKGKRVEQLCDYIIAEGYDFDIWAYSRLDTLDVSLLPKLWKAGFRWIALGIESGSMSNRMTLGKGSFTNFDIRKIVRQVKDNEINVVGNFMFGFSSDTYDTMQETLDLAFELNCEHVNFNVLMKGRKNGLSQYSTDCHPGETTSLTGTQVLQFRDNAFRQYFTAPSYLDMLNRTFGESAVEQVRRITDIILRRKPYGKRMEQSVKV